MRTQHIMKFRPTANKGTRLGCSSKTHSPVLSQLIAFQEFVDPHMERIERCFSPWKKHKHRYLSHLLGKSEQLFFPQAPLLLNLTSLGFSILNNQGDPLILLCGVFFFYYYTCQITKIGSLGLRCQSCKECKYACNQGCYSKTKLSNHYLKTKQ